MKLRTKNAAATLSAFGLLVLSSAAMATNGYFTHGVGTESKGMAGSGVGSNAVSGPIMGASNPALAAFAEDNWEVGLALFSPLRSYEAGSSLAMGGGGAFTIGPGKFDSSSNWHAIPHVAKNFRLSGGSVINVAFYGRGGMNTDWDDSDALAYFDPTGMGGAGQPFPGVYGDGDAGVDLMQAFLAVNWAGKAGDKFAWGLGPVFALQMFEANGLMSFMPYTETFNNCFFFQAPGSCDPTPSSLSNNGHDTSTGFGAAAGIWWSMGDAVSAGLAYQSKMSMSEFKDYSDLYAGAGSFDIPASLKFGLSFQGTNNVRLNLDIEHIEYGDVTSISNGIANIFNCPYAVYGGVLRATGDPAAALAAAQASPPENCLGGSNGAGFGWEDMTVFKLGMEWYANANTTYRFGYSYGEQPIPDSEVLFNILAPGVMEQHFTFGMTRKGSNGGAWNFSLMYAPSNSVKGVNPFDPTQELEIEMSQFEFEVSYLW
jgi:long-chain fatty acid transport protein